MDSLRVYLANGKHVDLSPEASTNAEALARNLGKNGVWSEVRGETLFHPAHRILYIRLVRGKSDEKEKSDEA